MRSSFLLPIFVGIVAIGCSHNTRRPAADDQNIIATGVFYSLISREEIRLINLDSITTCHSFACKDSSLVSTFDLLIGKMQYIDENGKTIAEGCCLGFEEGDWEAEGEEIGKWHYYSNDTTFTTDFGIRYKPWIQNLLESDEVFADGLISQKYPADFDSLDYAILENSSWYRREVENNSDFTRHIVAVYQRNPAMFLTKLHGTFPYKRDFCMRDMMYRLIEYNKIPKTVIAKDIASLPSLFMQNDLFEWLGYIVE